MTVCSHGNIDTDDPILPITYYTKHIVLMQGNKEHLQSFEKAYPSLQFKVEKENECVPDEYLDSEEKEPEPQPPVHITASPSLPIKGNWQKA